MPYDLWFLLTNSATISASVLICLFLWRTKRVSEWQALFVLCAFKAFSESGQLILQNHYAPYFWFYWCSDVVSAGLLMYVMADIIRSLPGERALSAEARKIFRTAAVMIALGGAWISFHASVTASDAVVRMAVLVDRSTDIAWGCFTAAALLSTVLLNLTWRLQGARVMTGYVVGMLVRVGASYAYASKSKFITDLASQLDALVWALVCVYWLISLCRPNPVNALTLDQTETIREQVVYIHDHSPQRVSPW